MAFQILWFGIWGFLWAVYFMLDGFDFGAAMLYRLVARDENEKRMILGTVGPVWDGNEVWLITAGGATFAAFSRVYATMFSFLYPAFLILLFSLILRGVSFELRGKSQNPLWQKGWDVAILVGGLFPAFLFGLAFGNIFKGLPFDANGYYGSFLGLLNPYGVLTGILFVVLFLVHGAMWVGMKTTGDLNERVRHVAARAWYVLVAIAVVFLVYTAMATPLIDNYLKHPIWLVVPILAIIGLIGIKWFTFKKQYERGFVSSALTVIAITATGLIGLYPNLIPSSIDSRYNLTAFDSSSGVYTLKVMTVVVAVCIPLVIAYQWWAYRVFQANVTLDDVQGDQGGY
ncbi:MAG: cytochrome d ubiquinol oxidase subunit II [Candidatus Omnitrophota bacterium]